VEENPPGKSGVFAQNQKAGFNDPQVVEIQPLLPIK
jgi:hypothetical protein